MTAIEQFRRTEGEVTYFDLNKNGKMDPYEDPRLPTEERVRDLLLRLSLEEKAGLMFQPATSVADSANIHDDIPRVGRTRLPDLIANKKINHLNLHYIPEPVKLARWINQLQAHAIEQTSHGIPVTFSTDPRHSFVDNFGASFIAEHVSAWPEPLGLAALRDEDTVREFARIARREYLALGIRAALHPTLDLATEPRWARQYSTFGKDADLVSRLTAIYLEEFEGEALGHDSVACMAKHFPGGGPQKDGEDAHFPYGREQVYPSNSFEYHLRPFRVAVEKNVSAIMPYYGMPVGLTWNGEEIESVGFGFNKQMITGLLREELGYTGVVCTDWGLVSDSQINGKWLPARAWGVEHLSESQRIRKVIDAGCDQFGGEECPELLVQLLEQGRIPEDRLNASVERLLKVKFDLGLFDNPFIDHELAETGAKKPEYIELGKKAQSQTATLIKDADRTIPAPPGTMIYWPEAENSLLRSSGFEKVNEAEQSDFAVVRVSAPFEYRDDLMLESSFHAGSLEFNSTVVERVRDLSKVTAVILVVHLDRPAILTELEPHCAVIIGVFGTSDEALIDLLNGRATPRGRLPFDLPRNMAQIIDSYPDSPEAIINPLYPTGFSVSARQEDALSGSRPL